MKAQARNLFPTWAYLSSPVTLFRQVVSSNRRSYSQFNIRGLTASGWRRTAYRSAASSPVYVGRPVNAFRCYGWMRAPSPRRVYSRAYRTHRRSKIESGIASNDQSIWKRLWGMTVIEGRRSSYARVPSLMRPSAQTQQASSRAVATLATTGRLRRSRVKCSRLSTNRFTPAAAWLDIETGTVSS